ncbi:MAG: Crp/Fnr family transcriptional regulator [Flavobacteriales bacterium]
MLFLFDVFKESLALTERDCTLISSHFQFKQLDKREAVLLPGSHGDYLILVEAGCLRSFVYDANDREFNLMFAYDRQWMADMQSFSAGEASKLTIEAMERSRIWIIEREDLTALMAQVPVLRHFFSDLSVDTICALQERITNSVTLTAKEHYRSMTQSQAELLRRVPQYHIANYLGITPESLSRIRKELILEITK